MLAIEPPTRVDVTGTRISGTVLYARFECSGEREFQATRRAEKTLPVFRGQTENLSL